MILEIKKRCSVCLMQKVAENFYKHGTNRVVVPLIENKLHVINQAVRYLEELCV